MDISGDEKENRKRLRGRLIEMNRLTFNQNDQRFI